MSNPALETQHRLWLDQSITKLSSKMLDVHCERIVDAICAASKETSEESKSKLSQLAVQLNTTKTLKKLLYDTDTFLSHSERAS